MKDTIHKPYNPLLTKKKDHLLREVSTLFHMTNGNVLQSGSPQ
jgi:hypothetical protein